MTIGSVHRAVGAHRLPDAVRRLSSLPDCHYADRFTLITGMDGTPEQWARAMFGDVPSAAELLIWRGMLHLRLSTGRSPATVAGWRIGGRGDGWIRLDAESWFLSCNLLVQADEGWASLATFIRYDRAVGHGVWPPLSALHRQLVPGVLRDAAAKIKAEHRP